MDIFGNKEPRPKWNDELQKKFVKEVADKVFKWCDEKPEYDVLLEDTGEILNFYRSEDGYELAKAYEDKEYNADSGLVETLDGVWFDKDLILNDVVKEWVSQNNIKPEHSIGDIVRFKLDSKDESGKIIRIIEGSAKYVIHVDGKSKGDQDGFCINYENVSEKISGVQ
jgi:hypothetical protein